MTRRVVRIHEDSVACWDSRTLYSSIDRKFRQGGILDVQGFFHHVSYLQ